MLSMPIRPGKYCGGRKRWLTKLPPRLAIGGIRPRLSLQHMLDGGADIGAVGIGETVQVILEHALLAVQPGRETEFESVFGQAKLIISQMPGFRQLTLSRCLERRSTYLMLVEWDTLEHHTEGFRGSPQYQQWRSMLHGFYDPAPTVEHFAQVHTA